MDDKQCDLAKFFEQVGALSESISDKNASTPALDLTGINLDCMEQAKEIQDFCAELGITVAIFH